MNENVLLFVFYLEVHRLVQDFVLNEIFKFLYDYNKD